MSGSDLAVRFRRAAAGVKQRASAGRQLAVAGQRQVAALPERQRKQAGMLVAATHGQALLADLDEQGRIYVAVIDPTKKELNAGQVGFARGLIVAPIVARQPGGDRSEDGVPTEAGPGVLVSTLRPISKRDPYTTTADQVSVAKSGLGNVVLVAMDPAEAGARVLKSFGYVGDQGDFRSNPNKAKVVTVDVPGVGSFKALAAVARPKAIEQSKPAFPSVKDINPELVEEASEALASASWSRSGELEAEEFPVAFQRLMDWADQVAVAGALTQNESQWVQPFQGVSAKASSVDAQDQLAKRRGRVGNGMTAAAAAIFGNRLGKVAAGGNPKEGEELVVPGMGVLRGLGMLEERADDKLSDVVTSGYSTDEMRVRAAVALAKSVLGYYKPQTAA